MLVLDLIVWIVLCGILLAGYELMNLLSALVYAQKWESCTKRGEGLSILCECACGCGLGQVCCKWLRVVAKIQLKWVEATKLSFCM